MKRLASERADVDGNGRLSRAGWGRACGLQEAAPQGLSALQLWRAVGASRPDVTARVTIRCSEARPAWSAEKRHMGAVPYGALRCAIARRMLTTTSGRI